MTVIETSLNTKKEKITFTLQCLSEENNYNKRLHRMCLSTSSFRFELPVSLIPFPKRQILDSSKLKEFADYNLKFDKNGRKVPKWVENTAGKGKLLDTSNFSISQSVFKRHILQTRKNQRLSGKG